MKYICLLLIIICSNIVMTNAFAKKIIKYSEFRRILIVKDWKPFSFEKNSSEFQEVVCGLGPDAICSATWVDNTGEFRDVDFGYDKRKNSKTKWELVTSKKIVYIPKNQEIYPDYTYPLTKK